MNKMITFTQQSLAKALGNVRGIHEMSVELTAEAVFQQASAAQSAPAGEREAFEEKYPTAKSLVFENGKYVKRHESHWQNQACDGVNDAWVDFQAGAAWQRTQSAGAPEGWPLKAMRFHANKIYERVDAAAALYESGKSALGFMEDAAESALYLRNSLDAMLAAAPAQPAAQDQGEVQRLREALEKIAAGEKVVERDGHSMVENDATIDYPGIALAALAASTGQEVKP